MISQHGGPPEVRLRKLPRQHRSRALVNAVIEAAAQLLVRGGRDAVTTNGVAVRAGVSIGSLYQYFPNREAILVAVARDHLKRVHSHVADIDVRSVDCLAGLTTRLVARLFEAHRISPALHLALAREIAAGFSLSDSDKPPTAKAAMVALFEAAGPAITAEIAGPDPRFAIDVAAEIGHALAHAAIECRDDSARHDRLEREAVRVMLAYLNAPQ